MPVFASRMGRDIKYKVRNTPIRLLNSTQISSSNDDAPYNRLSRNKVRSEVSVVDSTPMGITGGKLQPEVEPDANCEIGW
jgi:hypothetical protein